jgi:hypothetical protein
VGPVQVSVTSSNPTVGVITSSPVTFVSGQDSATTQFDPVEAGTTTLTAETPEGFSTPSNGHQVVATVASVAGPVTRLNSLTVGKDLQVSTTASLSSGAPAGGVMMTITVADPSKARLSTSKTTLGTGSITLPITAGGTASSTFYVQALAGSGTVQYTASAPGYTSSAGTLTLTPSGFVIPDIGESFTTNTSASDTTLTVHPASLDPVTLNLLQKQQLRPGLSNVVVTVSSEHPEVGSITLPQVVFQGADEPNHRTTSFHPVSAGSTVIVVSAPEGFNQASNNNFITAHVTH